MNSSNASPAYSGLPKDVSEKSQTQILNHTLDFFDALKEVLKGMSVTRHAWEGETPVYLSDGLLCIDIQGTKHLFLIRDVDMNSTDWYVL